MLLSKSNVIDLSTVILSNWKLIVFNVYGLPKGSNHNVSILFLIVSSKRVVSWLTREIPFLTECIDDLYID